MVASAVSPFAHSEIIEDIPELARGRGNVADGKEGGVPRRCSPKEVWREDCQGDESCCGKAAPTSVDSDVKDVDSAIKLQQKAEWAAARMQEQKLDDEQLPEKIELPLFLRGKSIQEMTAEGRSYLEEVRRYQEREIEIAIRRRKSRTADEEALRKRRLDKATRLEEELEQQREVAAAQKAARDGHPCKRARTAEAAVFAAIHAAKPKEIPLHVGCRVRIEGLMKRSDLNGREATIVTYDPVTSRWAVLCDGDLSCVLFELKEDNLLLVSQSKAKEDELLQLANDNGCLDEQRVAVGEHARAVSASLATTVQVARDD